MARQTLLLERIVEQSQQQPPRGRAPASDAAPYHQSAGSRMAMFLNMRPPTFDRAVDPLDADDWLRDIEKKLDLIQCDD